MEREWVQRGEKSKKKNRCQTNKKNAVRLQRSSDIIWRYCRKEKEGSIKAVVLQIDSLLIGLEFTKEYKSSEENMMLSSF